MMKTHGFSFSNRNIDNNLVVGGSFPLVDILGSKYLHTATLYHLKKMMIMFLSQLTSCDGDMLVKWHNSNTPLSLQHVKLHQPGTNTFLK